MYYLLLTCHCGNDQIDVLVLHLVLEGDLHPLEGLGGGLPRGGLGQRVGLHRAQAAVGVSPGHAAHHSGGAH